MRGAIGKILCTAVQLSMLLLYPAFSQTSETDQLLRHIRIETSDPSKLISELNKDHFDVIGSIDEISVDVIVSLHELEQLHNRGLTARVISKGAPLSERRFTSSGPNSIPSGYPSLQDMINQMKAAEENYPDIAKVINLTETYNAPTTFEGRHIYILKISDNVGEDEDEPDVMIVSNHHAREVVTPVIALYAIEKFTSQYGIHQWITSAVDNNEIWIAPTWNPDGYTYVYHVDDKWRKNRRVFPNGIGVDLNRNYPHLWDSPHSGSLAVTSLIYKGPSPASESETQTMLALTEDQRFAKLLDFHSSGREVLWGYAETPHPFDDWLRDEAITLSEFCSYGGKHRRPSADGENFQYHLARGTYANLVETHSQFAPNYTSAVGEAFLLWYGILHDIKRPIPLSGHVIDGATDEPIEADIELVGVNFQTGESITSGGPFGRYHIFAPPAQYLVRFSAEGYVPVEYDVSISDESQVLDVQLSKATYISRHDSPTKLPQRIQLYGNSPNPFNLDTVIHFRLLKPGYLQIEVYDQKGRQVHHIEPGMLHTGSHSVHWQAVDDRGRPLPSGIYFYRIINRGSDNQSVGLGKMVLMK